MEFIDINLRDGKELPFKEWNDHLKQDTEIENSKKTWNITPSINTDLSNGRTVYVNGHSYCLKTNIIYDSSHELFEDLVDDDPWTIIDIIKNLPDEEIENIILKIDRVEKVNKKFLLKYEEE